MTVVRLEATATRLQLQLQCHALLLEAAKAVAVGKTEMSSVDRIFVRILRRTVQKGVLLTPTNIWGLLEQVHREVMTAAAYTQHRRTKGHNPSSAAALQEATGAAQKMPPVHERPLVVGSGATGGGSNADEQGPRGPKTKQIKSNETSAGAVLLPASSPTRRALSRGGTRRPVPSQSSFSGRRSRDAVFTAGLHPEVAPQLPATAKAAPAANSPWSPAVRSATSLPPSHIWDDQMDNTATATAAGLPQSPGEMDNEPVSTKLQHPGGGAAAQVPLLDLSQQRLAGTAGSGTHTDPSPATSQRRTFAFSPGTGDEHVRQLAMSPAAPKRRSGPGSPASVSARRLSGSARAAGKLLRGVRGESESGRRDKIPSGVKASLRQGLPGIDGGSTIEEGGGARPRHVDTSEALDPESAAESVDAAEAVGWPIVLTVPIAVLLNFLAVDWELYFDWLAERKLRHPVVALDITEIGGGARGGGSRHSSHSHDAFGTASAAVGSAAGEQGGAGAASAAAAASQVGFSLGAVDAIVHEQARAEAAQDDAAKRHALASAMERMRAERASVRSESARSVSRFAGLSADTREGTAAMSESTDSLGSDAPSGFG